MKVEIFPAARASIKEIRQYTKKTWGKEQADNYIRELGKAIEMLSAQRSLWSSVGDERLKGIFFMRYRHHYIFFREFESLTIGIISILHESMDIPFRLTQDKNYLKS